ncbi:MAG: PIN domain-containing protein [Acidobacteria bacterium]|nr:PIN domain-containing protein [Acidobacteriota bacterium]
MAEFQLDTNVLLRSAEPAHPMHSLAVNAVKGLLENGDRVCLIPQNLIEFWNVASRPIENNGFGWNSARIDSEISSLESALTVLPDSQAIYREWKKLVVTYDVKGKQVHDTRIVAAMNVHGITNLLTFNLADFKRFEGINLIDPAMPSTA